MIRYLIQKEFLQMRRNAILPKIFVILPVVMLLIVPYAANQEVKNLTFCVVDNDHSTLSRRLVEQVAASEYFNLTAVTADYASAMAYVEAGSVDVILEIGPRFERDLVAAGHAAAISVVVEIICGRCIIMSIGMMHSGSRNSLTADTMYRRILRHIFRRSACATEKPATIMASGVFMSDI